jgi:hypothetical protein
LASFHRQNVFAMPLIGISLLAQLLCAVHCVRHGRNRMWLSVILLLSIPGCLAYVFFEVFPQYAGRREVRLAKAVALRRLDPERDIRAARDALDVANTAANQLALGDALAESGHWQEAIIHYERGVSMGPSGDRVSQVKLALANLEAGYADKARALLEELPPSLSNGENDRAKLLLARSLEGCGETTKALEYYADVGGRLPGGEAQCRQAALLIAEGRGAEAFPLLLEVERMVKSVDRLEKARQAEMYAWASRMLAELRGQGDQTGV